MVPHRVAILGAGPAGLATAWALTRTPALRAQHTVTIYQLGWRAGGQCATGRHGVANRIEQNGTHYIFGGFDESFRIVKGAYDELEAAGRQDFGTFDDAFLPRSFVVLKDFFQGGWHDWPLHFPTNDARPGHDTGSLSISAYLPMGLQALVELIAGWEAARSDWVPRAVPLAPLRHLVDRLEHPGAIESLRVPLARCVSLLRRAVRRALGARVEQDLYWRRAWILLDFAATHLRGILLDRADTDEGMEALDDVEYRDWLRRHGGSEVLLGSSIINAWYDSIAAYQEGDIDRPDVCASGSLKFLLRTFVNPKGAPAWQMRAEVGDSYIGPIVAALQLRGVSFAFFHRVWDVVPTPDGRHIAEVSVEQQATIRGGRAYAPFTTVRQRSCWPGAPLSAQLDRAVDAGALEDFYAPPQGAITSLRRGRDFDDVVYAMPVASVPHYCKRLLAQKAAWRRMVEHVTSVDTQSIRLWLKPSLPELGWHYPTPIVSGFAFPYSTWEDNCALADAETWPEGEAPGTGASLYGALPGPKHAPGQEDPGYAARQQAAAERSARHFVDTELAHLWPDITSPMRRGGVDWSLLVDLEHREGAKRMLAQSLRANAGPHERYTQAPAGSIRHRLRPDESGYDNLFLAGDWVRNGFEVGSIEGAVLAGQTAAEAIADKERT